MATAAPSKYATLPDIDTQPDVYETTVTDGLAPYSFLKPQEAEVYNEDIDIRTVPARQALDKFRESTGEPSGTNPIPPQVRRHRATLYRNYLLNTLPNAGEYQIDLSTTPLHETPSQKLQRLLFETQELADTLQAAEAEDSGTDTKAVPDADGKRTQPNLFTQVTILQNELASLATRTQNPNGQRSAIFKTGAGKTLLDGLQRLNVDKASAESTGVKEASPATTESSAAPAQESSYISQLEKRIADLESLLGLTSASSDPNQLQGRGILFVMQDLESKVKLLAQPHHLDGLSRRTKVLTQELEKLAAARARTENSSHLDDEVLEKINTLFGLVGKIDPLIDTVPSVVARLQSLQSLHLDASLVSQNLRQCTQEQTKFGEDTKALLDISNQLQDNIRTNTATIQSNVESLDVRITDLVQRAEKLKAP